jgi:hypothetical protein
MATSSFDKVIILGEEATKALIKAAEVGPIRHDTTEIHVLTREELKARFKLPKRTRGR